MKSKLGVLGATLLTINCASAAISFSLTAAVGLKASDGLTNVASGGLVLLVADTTGTGNNTSNGFLTQSTQGAVSTFGANALTASADRGVLAANASSSVGGFFGGDLILGAFSMSGGGSVAPGLTNVSIAGLENKSFSLIWFEKSASQLAVDGFSGAKYGILSGADWTLPSADSGAYTFNATTNADTSVYWQLGSATSAAQIGSTGFFTGSGTAGSAPVKSAVFSVVPEPSAALLGAIGALGLLRRRRN